MKQINQKLFSLLICMALSLCPAYATDHPGASSVQQTRTDEPICEIFEATIGKLVASLVLCDQSCACYTVKHDISCYQIPSPPDSDRMCLSSDQPCTLDLTKLLQDLAIKYIDGGCYQDQIPNRKREGVSLNFSLYGEEGRDYWVGLIFTNGHNRPRKYSTIIVLFGFPRANLALSFSSITDGIYSKLCTFIQQFAELTKIYGVDDFPPHAELSRMFKANSEYLQVPTESESPVPAPGPESSEVGSSTASQVSEQESNEVTTFRYLGKEPHRNWFINLTKGRKRPGLPTNLTAEIYKGISEWFFKSSNNALVDRISSGTNNEFYIRVGENILVKLSELVQDGIEQTNYFVLRKNLFLTPNYEAKEVFVKYGGRAFGFISSKNWYHPSHKSGIDVIDKALTCLSKVIQFSQDGDRPVPNEFVTLDREFSLEDFDRFAGGTSKIEA